MVGQAPDAYTAKTAAVIASVAHSVRTMDAVQRIRCTSRARRSPEWVRGPRIGARPRKEIYSGTEVHLADYTSSVLDAPLVIMGVVRSRAASVTVAFVNPGGSGHDDDCGREASAAPVLGCGARGSGHLTRGTRGFRHL